MSANSSLKAKLMSSLLWKAIMNVRLKLGAAIRLSCVAGSFLLGRCSYDKLRSFIVETIRTHRKLKMRAKGEAFNLSSYNGKRIMSLNEANDFIGQAIDAGKPFMAARYGSVELNATWRVRDDGKGFIAPMGSALYSMWHSAGFFPRDKQLLIKFAQIMKEATAQVDIMGVWFNPLEEWMLRTYGNNPEYCNIHSLDPFIAANSWGAKLKGKRVVVIHPFKSTIESQYKKRELLFPGRDVLPEFSLRIVKAVQTIVGTKDERFTTWFDALDYMYAEALKEDFDVAIIGCGAYGFPLAARIKQTGKIALHLGAVTQLLFGIRGRRWEVEYKGAYPEMMRNPAWVRPFDEDKPKGFDTHENGAYW